MKDELLRYAFEEASEQAARMPCEAVGAVVFVIGEDGTVAPILACEEPSERLVTRRFLEVAEFMTAEANSLAPAGDTLAAERILAELIRKVRNPR